MRLTDFSYRRVEPSPIIEMNCGDNYSTHDIEPRPEAKRPDL